MTALPADVLRAIVAHAETRPTACALRGAGVALNYVELQAAIDALAPSFSGRRVALLLDNRPAWALVDLAVWRAGAVCVPLPLFFSAAQQSHVLDDAGIDCLICEHVSLLVLDEAWSMTTLQVTGRTLQCWSRPPQNIAVTKDITKITYTSGTTGAPKGVCLSGTALATVTHSLASATAVTAADRCLALLPLSTLLENIGSVYVPLLVGGCALLEPLQTLGMRISTGIDVPRLLEALQALRPSGVILIPQLLQVLVQAVAAGWALPTDLRWLAVGGAPVPRALLAQAAALGLPVYEGYGLSEATSVVTLNTPDAQRPGSVGRPLPHARVRIAADGEILVCGALCSGYLHSPAAAADGWWPTGDLGHLDADGYLHVSGRKKHLFITAFGRNVSPEWVEGELLAHEVIQQAVVFGEGRPFNVAVIVVATDVDEARVQAAIAAANARLPEYARIGASVRAESAFTLRNGLLNPTGKPQRAAIARHYAAAIAALYPEVA